MSSPQMHGGSKKWEMSSQVPHPQCWVELFSSSSLNPGGGWGQGPPQAGKALPYECGPRQLGSLHLSLRPGSVSQRTNGQALRYMGEQPCALLGQGGHLPKFTKPLKIVISSPVPGFGDQLSQGPRQATAWPVIQHATV